LRLHRTWYSISWIQCLFENFVRLNPIAEAMSREEQNEFSEDLHLKVMG
jgi:hypothetical protein